MKLELRALAGLKYRIIVCNQDGLCEFDDCNDVECVKLIAPYLMKLLQQAEKDIGGKP